MAEVLLKRLLLGNTATLWSSVRVLRPAGVEALCPLYCYAALPPLQTDQVRQEATGFGKRWMSFYNTSIALLATYSSPQMSWGLVKLSGQTFIDISYLHFVAEPLCNRSYSLSPIRVRYTQSILIYMPPLHPWLIIVWRSSLALSAVAHTHMQARYLK